MKKFLFTLAALMMAGSAMADDYMYLNDFEVAQNQLGTTIEVSVPAHFDNAVSAWEVWFTMPEGMEISYAEQGADMTITYIKANGRTGSLVAPFYFQGAGHYITAVADPGYWQVDGAWVSYGAVKWLADDYEEMIFMEVDVAADFAGGDITIKTAPSCGTDTRPDVIPCANETYEKVCHVTVEGGSTPEPEALAGTVDVTFNGNVATLSYDVNDPNATAVVTVNGDAVEVEWNRAAHTATWTAPQNTAPGTYTYVVKLTVTGDGTNYVGTLSDDDTYTYTIKEKTATPEIIIDETHHNFVKFHVEGDGEVLVYIDGDLATPDANGYYYVYASTTEDVTYVVTATAQEEGKDISDPATKTIEIAQWDSVNELVNGKTVAGVRYYNMAGQEMQQANGMTIVVTTYTDGTTSAVKVMK